jgi:hypothetical protein
MGKADMYAARLLRENPKTTRGGVPITIESNGYCVKTYSGRSNNGCYSVYGPCDYPQLFGWNKEPSLSHKLDMVMEHLGLEFEYQPAQLKIVTKPKTKEGA